MTDPILLQITYPYSQQVFPYEGGGKLNGLMREWLATDNIGLWPVSADGTEEVATLAFEDGAAFTILRHDGKLFRPVFVPGTHAPCDVEAFEEACKGDVPWLDSPFDARDAGRRQTNHPVKAEIDGKTWPEPGVYRKLGESRRDERLDQINKKASELIVVDGIVHVPCDEPVLVLRSPVGRYGAKPEALVLGWSMDRLGHEDSAETGPTEVKFPPPSSVGMVTNKRPEPVKGERVSWRARPWRTFGLSEGIEATRLGTAYAEASGVAFKADPNLVTVIRDWHLAGVPKVPLDRFAKEAFGRVSSEVTKLSRESVMDWMEARDATKAGSHIEVLDALDRVVARPDDGKLMTWGGTSSLTSVSSYSYSSDVSSPDREDAMAGLLRYRLIERPRLGVALVSKMDENAFADIGVDFDEPGPAPGM